MAADVGRAPAGGRSPEGGSGGGTPAGPCRSFPSPQGQVPSASRLGGLLPVSLGVVKRLLGAERAAEPGGGLKTRAARHGPAAAAAAVAAAAAGVGRWRRGAPSRGGELLPPIPCGGVSVATGRARRRRRPAALARARGPPVPGRGRGALPPPLCGPVSAERPRRAIGRGGPTPLASAMRGDAGRGRALSALPTSAAGLRPPGPAALSRSFSLAAAAGSRAAPRQARPRASRLDGLVASNRTAAAPAAGHP